MYLSHMIEATTFQFLQALKKNNHKEWFDAHKKDADQSIQNVAALTERLIGRLATIDDSVAAAGLEGKKCLSRLYRDVRFSKDKTPYKTNFFAIISRGGKKSPYAGFYLHIEPGECFAGGGVYMPEPAELLKFRKEIDYNTEEWKAIVEKKSFLTMFPAGVEAPSKLTRMPKDFEADSPGGDYLRYKGYYTVKSLPDSVMQSAKAEGEIMAVFKAVLPMVHFLNTALTQG
jgi:uncharacterized protein (TIGR02453 family)